MESLPELVLHAMSLRWELRTVSGSHPRQCQSLCKLKSFTHPALAKHPFPFTKMNWRGQLSLLERGNPPMCPRPSSGCDRARNQYNPLLAIHLPKLRQRLKESLRNPKRDLPPARRMTEVIPGGQLRLSEALWPQSEYTH